MKKLAPIFQLSGSDLKKIASVLPSKEPVLSGTDIIPVCEPDIGHKERLYVKQAIESSWISSAGDFVERFERLFARNVSHTRYAYAVNSGTSALHIALAAVGIQAGDEVILPTFTMVATANAIVYCGATPVFIDADPLTWNINVRDIESRITVKTKAIIVVHTYGLPVQMNEVIRLAKKHKLWIIEDAAEAHGAQYRQKPAGSFGDVSAFSLYANKLLTTGEGGMVVTNNPQIARRIDLLRNHAFSEDRHFWHTMIGFGYRMTNLQAAVGLAQTERFTSLLRRKREHAALYRALLHDIPGISLPYESQDAVNSYWMFGMLVNEKLFGMSKNTLRVLLAAQGIETRSFFIPVHLQPPYVHAYGMQQFPVSEVLCRDGVYLPSSVCLLKQTIMHICSSIRALHHEAAEGAHVE